MNNDPAMNATLETPAAVILPNPQEIRIAARNLYRANRRPYFEMVVDVDQTDRCAERLHDEQDASLYRLPMVIWPTRAADLWRTCLIVAEFRHWEGLGLARIRVEADYDTDTSFADDQSPAYRAHVAEMEGYGTIGQYRLAASERFGYFGYEDETEGWKDVDSCWGHLGYDDPADPFENEYVVDHMCTVNETLRAAFDPSRTFGEGI